MWHGRWWTMPRTVADYELAQLGSSGSSRRAMNSTFDCAVHAEGIRGATSLAERWAPRRRQMQNGCQALPDIGHPTRLKCSVVAV